MRRTHYFKAGATFSYVGGPALVGMSGATINADGWGIASWVRFPVSGREVVLDAEWLDVAASSLRLSCEDTADWPPGMAEIDIRFTSPDGVTIQTTTAQFLVTKGVTGAPD